MAFNAFRTAARRSAFAVPPRVTPARVAFRKYSSEVPKSSNAWVYGLGGLAAAGLGYYAYTAATGPSTSEAGTAVKSAAQAAKVAANFVPTKEDYQKARKTAE